MKRETYRQLTKGLHYGHNGSGWLLLIRMPLGHGLNLGTGFSGYWSLRSWAWARYDFADHFTYLMFGDWSLSPASLEGLN